MKRMKKLCIMLFSFHCFFDEFLIETHVGFTQLTQETQTKEKKVNSVKRTVNFVGFLLVICLALCKFMLVYFVLFAVFIVVSLRKKSFPFFFKTQCGKVCEKKRWNWIFTEGNSSFLHFISVVPSFLYTSIRLHNKRQENIAEVKIILCDVKWLKRSFPFVFPWMNTNMIIFLNSEGRRRQQNKTRIIKIK